MSELDEFVDLQILVQDATISEAGFGTILIAAEFATSGSFPGRVKEYTGGSSTILTDIAADHGADSLISVAAEQAFAQEVKPTAIKVGRIDSGDTDLTAALTAIEAEDGDWYALMIADRSFRDKTNFLLAASFVETRQKIFGYSTEDAEVLDDLDTDDIMSQLQDLARARSFGLYHHQSGINNDGVSINVASEEATVTETAHGVRVGDPIIVRGATPAALNGRKTVTEVVDTDNYKYSATGVVDGAATGTIDIDVRYTFPEAAWMGLQLPKKPGSTNWAHKQLSGVTRTPSSLMSATQKSTVMGQLGESDRGKGGNVYVERASRGVTLPGQMHSGRFIDITRGIDKIHAGIQERIFLALQRNDKIPYTAAGQQIFVTAITAELEEGIRDNVLQPLLDDDQGRRYIINVTAPADQTDNDRANRKMDGFEFTAQLAGAVNKVVIRGTVLV